MARGCVVDVAFLPLLFSHQGILGVALPLPDLNVDSFEPPSRFHYMYVRHNHSSSEIKDTVVILLLPLYHV